MYTATVLLSIQGFVPTSGIYGQGPFIDATVNPPTDTSPPPKPPYEVFTGDGQSITITISSTYVGAVALTFQLPSPDYVIIGLAFKSVGGQVGQAEFPAMTIYRDPSGSQLTLIDSCDAQDDKLDFNYSILIQEVSSGNIGVIDPDIETVVIEE